MKVAIMVSLVSCSFLIILAFWINETYFGETQLSKQYRIPRICLPAVKNTLLCYTCLRRSMSQNLRLHPIHISSIKEFSYVVFGHRTQYTCDQLFQLVDSKSYLEDQSLKVQYLQSVYDTIKQLKGTISRVNEFKIKLEIQQQQVLILQIVTEQQKDHSFISAITVSISTEQKLNLTIRILIILSFSFTILVELYKLLTQIRCRCVVVLNLLLIMMAYFQFQRSINSFINQKVNSLQIAVFFIIILWEQQDNIVYILYLFLLLFANYQQAVIIFIMIFLLHNYNLLVNSALTKSIVSLHTVLIILAFTLNWFFLNNDSHIQNTILHNIIYWIILLYSPLMNTLIAIYQNKTIKITPNQTLNINEDESLTLNHIHL